MTLRCDWCGAAIPIDSPVAEGTHRAGRLHLCDFHLAQWYRGAEHADDFEGMHTFQLLGKLRKAGGDD